MRNIGKAIVTASFLGAFIAPKYANAQEAVTVVNPQLPVTVTNYEAIDTAIVEAIQQASGQDTANITSLAKDMANSSDVSDQAKVKYGVDEARLAALESATSGPGDCSALEAGASMSGFGAEVSQEREQLADENLNWLSNSPTISGSPNPAAVSPTLAYDKVLKASCSGGYASAADIAAGACGSSSATPGANAGLDTNATNLFTNMDFSPTQATAAQMFYSNAISPSPLPIMTSSLITSPAGPEIIAGRNGIISRVSLAGLFVSGAIMRRQPWTSAPSGVADWANGEASQLGGAIPQTNGSYFPNGVSQMDYMEVRADSYVYDTKFLAGVSAQTSDAPLLKTLIQIDGFRTWLEFQHYKLDEERGLMEAALLANSQIPTSNQPP